MFGEVRFEEENKKERESGIKICWYIIWGVMIASAIFLASRALEAEGKEIVRMAAPSTIAVQEYL